MVPNYLENRLNQTAYISVTASKEGEIKLETNGEAARRAKLHQWGGLGQAEITKIKKTHFIFMHIRST